MSSLPVFLYLKLIGVNVVVAMSFFAGICGGLSFFIRHTFQEDFLKRDTNIFFICAV